MGRKRKLVETMTRDIRNVARGQCQACGDCEGFISVNGRVLCDYCGCPPAQHENLVCKKPKSDPDIVKSGLEILELEDNTEEDTTESSEEEQTNSGYKTIS